MGYRHELRDLVTDRQYPLRDACALVLAMAFIIVHDRLCAFRAALASRYAGAASRYAHSTSCYYYNLSQSACRPTRCRRPGVHFPSRPWAELSSSKASGMRYRRDTRNRPPLGALAVRFPVSVANPEVIKSYVLHVCFLPSSQLADQFAPFGALLSPPTAQLPPATRGRYLTLLTCSAAYDPYSAERTRCKIWILRRGCAAHRDCHGGICVRIPRSSRGQVHNQGPSPQLFSPPARANSWLDA
ncbi:hypothetical protein C8F01DRAFT_753704 [Mycena amicta]|nr:hypothetical protein C8F01DRAFT_753704 [Mycena amicta]